MTHCLIGAAGRHVWLRPRPRSLPGQSQQCPPRRSRIASVRPALTTEFSIAGLRQTREKRRIEGRCAKRRNRRSKRVPPTRNLHESNPPIAPAIVVTRQAAARLASGPAAGPAKAGTRSDQPRDRELCRVKCPPSPSLRRAAFASVLPRAKIVPHDRGRLLAGLPTAGPAKAGARSRGRTDTTLKVAGF